MTLPPPQNDSERLERILLHLERMDRRDRLRTIGGFFRSIIMFIPVLLIILSAWYFYKQGDALLEKIASITAKRAMQYSEGNSKALMDQLQEAAKSLDIRQAR